MPPAEIADRLVAATARKLLAHDYWELYVPNEATNPFLDPSVRAWILGTPPRRLATSLPYIFGKKAEENALYAWIVAWPEDPRDVLQGASRVITGTVHIGCQLALGYDEHRRHMARTVREDLHLHAQQVLPVSLEPSALVLDYLKVSARNVFNRENTPVHVRLMAQDLRLTQQEVLRACAALVYANKIEAERRDAQNQFFRVRADE
jgi:hypothetical protein